MPDITIPIPVNMMMALYPIAVFSSLVIWLVYSIMTGNDITNGVPPQEHLDQETIAFQAVVILILSYYFFSSWQQRILK